MHLQVMQDQLIQCDDFFVWLSHFVGGHADKNMMRYDNIFKETIEFFVFTTLIGLHSNYFLAKLLFNKLLKIKKGLINIGLFL